MRLPKPDTWDAFTLLGVSLVIIAVSVWTPSGACALTGSVMLGVGLWGSAKWGSSQR